MTISYPNRVKELLDRIARVTASQDWGDNLNPAQRGVLAYLSSANRFSRTPSNIADYMCTTRGTTSQTLKALERKELVSQSRSPTDKRSISYDITASGLKVLTVDTALDETLNDIDQKKALALSKSLEAIARQLLAQGGYKPFGICSDCKYHKKSRKGLYCSLLKVSLTQNQAAKLCHEHIPKHTYR